ncbi:unnamed protein product [Spodoptera exigua]|nr:unnamed protein product [Spodoptera exigua]
MTNVKLKLMFFLLNALLTADIVHARPYSDMNNTDIVIKFGNNNTFNLPIDPNSDTLIVAEETDEEIRETDRTSKSELEGLMNAEQGRDEDLSKKVMRDQTKTMDIPNGEGGNVEKQMNISSSLLDDIINSETDREDTITDILFRPESEFAEDMPKFEFLIAAKINESDFLNRSVSEIERDRNSSDVLKKVDYVELVEVAKPSKENRSALIMNITGHEVDNDLAPDTILSVFSGYSDVQTLFLACFGTLLPLLAVLFATLLIRCLCRRYCPTFCKKHTGSTTSESSEKQDNNHQQRDSLCPSSGNIKMADDDDDNDGDDENFPISWDLYFFIGRPLSLAYT